LPEKREQPLPETGLQSEPPDAYCPERRVPLQPDAAAPAPEQALVEKPYESSRQSQPLNGGAAVAHQLSFGHILKRDWPSFILSVFVCGLWLTVIFLLGLTPSPEDKEAGRLALFMGVGTLLVTAVCGTVIAWRLLLIHRVFAHGEVVQGRVLHVGENSEDIGYAVIVYQYQGREHRVKNVTGVGRGGLAPDDPVDIVVDPRKPARAFIVKLYVPEA
jgi:hypothetical protein